ncbi:MAG TPA: FimV/HubP family polar landmark protein [Burkholderiales bacterium]|nr:FimV/HubP family polar landmark protein [Burkholderiales bacterium]
MNAARIAGAVLLAWAGLATVPAAVAQDQVRATHEVRRGDTLFAVARKAKHDGVTRNQMILAIYRANPGAFPGGNVNILAVGTILNIPSREVVAAIDPAEADRAVRGLLAAKPAAVPPVATIKPVPKPEVVPPGMEKAAKRYRDGLNLERQGDDKGALAAFLEAGEAGYGLAQRKLGQIYDKGNSVVSHDYQAALKWYQKAREQGVEIDKPLQRMTPK